MSANLQDERLACWFVQWRKPLRSWLMNRGRVPSAEADDLVQDVFVRLLRYSDTVKVEKPVGYLFRIASNVANEWRERSRVKAIHRSDWLDELIAESDEPLDSAFWRRGQEAVIHEALLSLPERQHEVLRLHIHDDLTVRQISDRTGLSKRTVMKDLVATYWRLRIELKEFADPTAELKTQHRNRRKGPR